MRGRNVALWLATTELTHHFARPAQVEIFTASPVLENTEKYLAVVGL